MREDPCGEGGKSKTKELTVSRGEKGLKKWHLPPKKGGIHLGG